MRFDVYFYEAFTEEEEALRRHLPAHLKVGFTGKTIQEQADEEPPAAVISIRTQSTVPDAWSAKLSAILSRTTGYDHLQNRLTSVARGYLPLYCNRAVAEQAILMIMALLRKLPQQIDQFGRFNRNGLTGRECEQKKLLCVGVGHIGAEVIKIATALGMEVRGVDIVQTNPALTYVTIEEGLSWADVVVCAMSLTAESADFFSYHRLKKIKRGTIFVNVARGELSPTADLVWLLDEEHLGGVALDVYENESQLAVALRSGEEMPAAIQALAQRSNVILTPHNAFNTQEAVERKATQSVQQIEHFRKHGRFLWTIP